MSNVKIDSTKTIRVLSNYQLAALVKVIRYHEIDAIAVDEDTFDIWVTYFDNTNHKSLKKSIIPRKPENEE